MSIDARIADNQPDSFAFTRENEAEIKRIVAKYPKGRQASAVMPLLDLAQRQHDNWIPMKAIEVIAKKLDMAEIRVLEVATFYTMFRLQPVGKFHVQLCGTTPCQLRGAEKLKEVCQKEIGDIMYVTDVGRLSWEEVECLGACANAPMIQINDYFFEDLTPATTVTLLDDRVAGRPVPLGPQGHDLSGGLLQGALLLRGGCPGLALHLNAAPLELRERLARLVELGVELRDRLRQVPPLEVG